MDQAGATLDTGVDAYHLFEVMGVKFAYDTGSGRAFRIDDATHRFLELRRGLAADDAARQVAREGLCSEDGGLDLVSEWEWLEMNGFFRARGHRTPPEEAEAQIEQRFTRPRTKLELALAENCNLACRYCYCRNCSDTAEHGAMPDEIVRESIDWLFAGCGAAEELSITLFGGEPLLNKRGLKLAVDYSQELGERHGKRLNYSLTTNGTLLDDEVIDYIKRYAFGLMVSLDGPPELHDGQCPFRDGRGSFEAAAAGIRSLMRRRKLVTVRCTMTNARPRIMELVRFFDDFGFTRMVLGRAVNPASPSPVDCDPEALADFDRQEEEEVLPWILEEFEQGRVPKYFPYATTLSLWSNADSPGSPSVLKCGACLGTLTVGADGTFFPCHRYVGMSAFAIGSLRAGVDLDKAKDYWRAYNRTIEGECSRCWARLVCGRSCPWEVSTSAGGFAEPDPHRCEFHRRFLERAAYVHYRLQKDFPAVLERITHAHNVAGET